MKTLFIRTAFVCLVLFMFFNTLSYADEDYVLTVASPTVVTRGYDAYVRVRLNYVGANISPLRFNSITTSDPSVTALAWCDSGHQSCYGANPNTFYLDSAHFFSPSTFWVHVTTQDNTPLGAQTITLHTTIPSINVNDHVLPIYMTVQEVPIVPIPGELVKAPVPMLDTWKARMKTLGTTWCAQAQGTLTSGNETQIWYYDGPWTYLRLSDMDPTNGAFWRQCAWAVAHQYRDFINVNHLGQTWRYFPQGLKEMYLRNVGAEFGEGNSDSYRDAVLWLANSGTEAPVKDELYSDYWIREASYTLETFVEAEKLGNPRSSQMPRLVDYMLNYGEEHWIENNYWIIIQPFYEGLWMQSLIDYYEWTKTNNSHPTVNGDKLGPDPRVPPMIKAALDGIWTSAWDDTNFQMAYNMGMNVQSGECGQGASGQYGYSCCSTVADGACWNGATFHYSQDLTGLIVPGYGWYWRISGDDIYRLRGDELFKHMFDVQYNDKGKSYNQAYRWTFDYVKWRTTWETGSVRSSGIFNLGLRR